jgi:hypothetical protein
VPNWEFELVGDSQDLKALAELFEQGPARVKFANGKFRMESDTIAPSADTHEAIAAAEAILRTINGIVALTDPASRPVSLGSLFHGGSTVVIPGPAVARTRVPPVGITVGGVKQRPKTERILRAALADAEVDHVMRIYASANPDWRDLYAILEVVERAIKPATIGDKGWSSNNEVSRFTQTANSREALGPLARHGKTFKAPKKPMTLSEARTLIAHIVDRWLLGEDHLT